MEQQSERGAAELAQSAGRAARLVEGARHLVVFTGAGISVECGIPPFRGPGGLWATVDPRLADRSYFLSHPAEVWDFWRERFFSGIVAEARPGAAHKIIAGWEQAGRVQAVITQNVDSLHRKAGSREVLELHGSCRDLRCEQCAAVLPASGIDLSPRIPPCPVCRTGMLRPNLVMFEEPLAEAVWQQAERHMEQADVVLVVGTSGEVYPAAELPRRAARRGAAIVRVDPAASPHLFGPARGATEILLRCGAGQGLTMIDEALGPRPATRRPATR